jgi:hypothetical protein
MRSPVLVSMLLAAAAAACGDNDEPGAQPDAGAPDGGPTEIPLERAHAGGETRAIALAGGRAYVAIGPRLTVWDLAASPPALLGESAPLRGVIDAVAIGGNRAYVAERLDLDSRIHVLDITAAQPVETHAFSLAEPGGGTVVHDLEIARGRLYVADQEQGVFVLDLANPDAPSEVRLVPMGGVADLTIVGDRLYYTSASFLGGASGGALDLGRDLADLGSAPLGNLKGVAFGQDLAIGAGPDGIYVYDVSDPSNPVERFHRGEPELGPFARKIAVHGTTAWVPADDGLHVLDLRTPTAIVHRGPEPVATTNVNATAASADVVVIATDRGRLLAVDPADTTQVRDVDLTLCADCVGLEAAGATLYVADIVGGLRTASLASLAALGRSAPLPAQPGTGGLQFVYEDVALAGSHAVVADWLYGVRIYDVSRLDAPDLVGSLATGGSPSAVAVVGDRAYVAEGTNGGALRVVDLTDRTRPALLGTIETSKAMAVEVRGAHAFVADESLFGPGGLRIVDVTNPAAMVQVGYYSDDCLWASDVALAGDIAVVACAGNGFHLVDVSSPASPTRIAIVDAGVEIGTAISVATWEGHAALGHNAGVVVLDLATRAPVAQYPTAWPVRGLSVPTPGRLVAACGPAGVYQWQLQPGG